jgi:hypothetical protein
MVAKKKKADPKPKATKPEYLATITLNTTKAPFAVSGKFLSASDNYVKLLGEVGDDIGKIIMVPQHMVKVIHMVEM